MIWDYNNSKHVYETNIQKINGQSWTIQISTMFFSAFCQKMNRDETNYRKI